MSWNLDFCIRSRSGLGTCPGRRAVARSGAGTWGLQREGGPANGR
jgi:hypothetical protein